MELFGDGNYAGEYFAHFGPGSYTSAQLRAGGAQPGSASSIKIPAGWTATLFSADNFKGRSVTLSGNIKSLGDVGGGFNDATQSMTVSKTGGVVGGPVVLYTGKNYTGKTSAITTGSYTTAQLKAIGIPDDGLASIHVPPGYVVYLVNGGVPTNVYYAERLLGDSSDVTADSVSSILVTGHPVLNSTEIADGTYRIQNAKYGRVAGVGRREDEDGSRVKQFEYTGAVPQLWNVEQAGDGSYTFTDHNDELRMVVDLKRHACGDNAPVRQTAPSTSATQRWFITPNGDFQTIASAASHTFLEGPAVAFWDGVPLTTGLETAPIYTQWSFELP